MANQIHVAVLDTDVPCQTVYAQRGLYSSQFRVLLQSAAERVNTNAELQLQNGPLAVYVTAFDAVGGTLPPLEYLRSTPRSPADSKARGPFSAIDAILITGSACSAYDPHPWIRELESFIQIVHENFPHVKMFGSCFGHQIIAQALLSGSATKNKAGTENETHSQPHSTFHVEPSPLGFELGIQPIILDPSFTANFPVLAHHTSSTSPFRVQLVHGDIVVPTPAAKAAALAAGQSEIPLPPGWMSIGHSAACDVQGLYYPGRILTYQGHFEFDVFTNRELCIEFGRRSNWPTELVQRYVEWIERALVPGAEDDDDAKAAAEAVLIFFAGEDQTQAAENSSALGLGLGLKLGGLNAPHGMLTPPLE
ncbi:hypothetical protein N7466_004333 [Penicillium verhagenii]|uniref:uncharacterized protein n=1 Tax=Penicillium verhagenii TaxID=1562060 RepID=UPI0025451927|nr:uncharacterized protein N7466_004333 [Penicillium verhagenii]KAJ5934786.1 hypothetical protein N7466_004333 [Penicillium verhagenii]